MKNLITTMTFILFCLFNLIDCIYGEKVPDYKVLKNVYTIEHLDKDQYNFVLVRKNLRKVQVDMICKDLVKKYPGRYFYIYSDKATVCMLKKHIQKGKMDYELTDVMKKNWIGLIDDRSGELKFFPLAGYYNLD